MKTIKLKVFILMFSLFLIHPKVHSQDINLEIFATGFSRPSAISHAGDSRLFVVEQDGIIKIIDSLGNTKNRPFLDISEKVTRSGNEQGLLGLAFHPDFQTNRFFYVNYTGEEGATFISRFAVSETDSDSADRSSEFQIISYAQPYPNHNGGDLKFGPDSNLYIGTGDGGSAGDPGNRAQDSSILLGKMLRIDIDGGSPYAIPDGNPFEAHPEVRGEIWALGLRNPWRYSFDRETGDLWIADVGQGDLEEINFQPSSSKGGENYGWRCYEGNSSYNNLNCETEENYVFPVHQYHHDPAGHCSVSGGFVYRGKEFPNLKGQYFFADFCSDRIWSIRDSSGTWVLHDYGVFPDNSFSTFGEDRDGELYIAGLVSGTIYKIVDAESTSVSPYQSEKDLMVYPNPSTDRLWIKTGKGTDTRINYVIYNLQGQVLLRNSSNRSPVQIDLNSLIPGVYYVEIDAGNNKEIRKLLKK